MSIVYYNSKAEGLHSEGLTLMDKSEQQYVVWTLWSVWTCERCLGDFL